MLGYSFYTVLDYKHISSFAWFATVCMHAKQRTSTSDEPACMFLLSRQPAHVQRIGSAALTKRYFCPRSAQKNAIPSQIRQYSPLREAGGLSPKGAQPSFRWYLHWERFFFFLLYSVVPPVMSVHPTSCIGRSVEGKKTLRSCPSGVSEQFVDVCFLIALFRLSTFFSFTAAAAATHTLRSYYFYFFSS